METKMENTISDNKDRSCPSTPPTVIQRRRRPSTISPHDDDYSYQWESTPTGCLDLERRTSKDASGGGLTPTGILRVDLGKVYGTNLTPTELKFLSQVEPTSPQPSIDRLSVTFAEDSTSKSFSYNAVAMDKVHFPDRSQEVEDSNEEDYSESVIAIMHRRASLRRSKKRRSRRGSSPFSPDVLPEVDTGRRRSSCFTTSSGDTAITLDDSFSAGVTQEQIFENIKLHKEVLSSVKMQPWNMRRKLKLVQQAKSYIKKHEGALQERLAHSHSTKDILARFNIYFVKKLQKLKREMANLSNWLIPWELRIKEIESHFGSVVASYFIFLRWLFWVNIAISSIWIAFATVPELLTADIHNQSERKSILPEDKYNATNFLTLWDFEGVFKYSPMFYGWYTNVMSADYPRGSGGYRLPLAYFFTGLAVYIFSFVATLRKMAENSRMSKLSEKEDECIFSWKLFTGWDYMIGNAETATNRVASIIMSFKEALLEEAEKKREALSWKIIGSRILVNIGVLTLLGLSAFAVITVVARSEEKGASTSTTWRRNEITVVMSLIAIIFPILFELLGYFEHYHPRKQLRLQLARIMVLNLLNLYSLIFALFGKISTMTETSKNFTAKIALLGELDLGITETYSSNYQSQTEDQNFNLTNSIEGIELQVGNLVREVLQNVSEIIETTTNIDTTWNSTDILDYITNKTTNAILNLNLNNDQAINLTNITNFSPEYLTSRSFEQSVTPTVFENMTDTSNDYEINELDFTPIRGAIEELLTTLINIFENTTSVNLNDTLADFNFDLDYKLNSTLSNLVDTTISTMIPNLSNLNLTTLTNLINISDIPNHNINTDVTNISPKTPYHDLTPTPYIKPKKSIPLHLLNYQNRTHLRNLCWETMFGQELVKLTIMDLIFTLFSILMIDFFRGIFVRYMNNCWCWDLEMKFPQYGDFKVAENILHLVNNQGMVWMGMFFSPGLVIINVVKLYIMMYLRSWAVLTCNVPHEVIFRASRSNNFYYALLLMMLFLCVLPVSYAMVWLKPSPYCGPFSGYKRIYHIFTQTLREELPKSTHKILDYIASPGIVIPLLMLLVLIIYYLISLSAALREANNDLKIQLRRERTEERRKMFQIVDRRRRGGSDGSDTNNPFGKWKKLLKEMPSNKSMDMDYTPTPTPQDVNVAQPKIEDNKKGEISKLITRAIKEANTRNFNETNNTSAKQVKDTQSHEQSLEDGTDTETNDSVLDDSVNGTSVTKSNKTQKSQKTNKPTDKTDKTKQKHHEHGKRDKLKHCKDSIDIHDKSSKKASGGVVFPSKKYRKDSNASNWSEVIPVITISKTESSECILEDKSDGEVSKCGVKHGCVDIADDSPKIRYALKKQPVITCETNEQNKKTKDTNETEEIKENVNVSNQFYDKNVDKVEREESDIAKEAKKGFQESKNFNSTQTTTNTSTTTTLDTRTESSTDYKDSVLSLSN